MRVVARHDPHRTARRVTARRRRPILRCAAGYTTATVVLVSSLWTLETRTTVALPTRGRDARLDRIIAAEARSRGRRQHENQKPVSCERRWKSVARGGISVGAGLRNLHDNTPGAPTARGGAEGTTKGTAKIIFALAFAPPGPRFFAACCASLGKRRPRLVWFRRAKRT